MSNLSAFSGLIMWFVVFYFFDKAEVKEDGCEMGRVKKIIIMILIPILGIVLSIGGVIGVLLISPILNFFNGQWFLSVNF